MSGTQAVHDIALALLNAVGMSPDKITGLTLTLDVNDVPRLEVRALIFDGAEVAETISRYKLTAEPDEPAAA